MALPTNHSLLLPALLKGSKTSINHSFTISPKSPLTISETFSRLKKQRKVGFIPYITAGDPDLCTTEKALRLLSSCGADLIEVGLPYSDPILDGPVIQASTIRALTNGVNFQAVVSMLGKVVPQLSCPIILFSYYNQILKINQESFMSALNYGGIQGLIVPDLPFEDIGSLKKTANKKNIDLVLLAAPTTSNYRLKAIVDATDGFLYLVSTNGVTGARSNLNSQVQFRLEELKKETSKPIAVGFGISKPEHVKQLSIWGANGVIVGSAIVKLLGESKSSEEGLRLVETFTKSLTSALP
ncbi:hypothetical protein KFK09_015757 [Dendrobium nobile]|uniref:Tryptophan synthase n=1 Tax=Dendrobium nobile TaxID=94219 RepID=A0A8T3B5P7_DENNO|nr:hypothetical protein KFK09_015757 [Dendrobium nobile]